MAYHEFFSPSHKVDQLPEFVDWFLIKTPVPVVTIAVSYLLFTLKLGPSLMERRKPFNLKLVMMIYNLFQSVSNAYMVAWFFIVDGAFLHWVKNYCHPVDISLNSFLNDEYLFSWLFLISKITDMLDTVFFVFRKKDSQVTFLHVYHHADMVVATWFLIRYFPADVEKLIFFEFVNAFVHTVMYSYYFLACLGPKVQKYLWWKVYVTRLQILQFIVNLTFIGHLIYAKCYVHPIFAWFTAFQLLMFLVLFVNFYVRTYVIMSKKAPLSVANSKVVPETEEKKTT